MRAYGRDYTVLTSNEKIEYERVLEKEKDHKFADLDARMNLFREYPKAARHYLSLFPNNYLDIVDLENDSQIKSVLEQFLNKLNSGLIADERDIVRFIKEAEAYYIIGSILNYYDFGHHEACIFPEFQLSSTYRVDYLLVGRNSDGYSFLFVELEHPKNQITLSDGELGSAFRKGIKQIRDWRNWLNGNFSTFTSTIKNYKHPVNQMPDEFYSYDPTRCHYVVVAGRRDDLNDTTRRIRREHLEEQKIRLLHYDNIIDTTLDIIKRQNY